MIEWLGNDYPFSWVLVLIFFTRCLTLSFNSWLLSLNNYHIKKRLGLFYYYSLKHMLKSSDQFCWTTSPLHKTRVFWWEAAKIFREWMIPNFKGHKSDVKKGKGGKWKGFMAQAQLLTVWNFWYKMTNWVGNLSSSREWLCRGVWNLRGKNPGFADGGWKLGILKTVYIIRLVNLCLPLALGI